MLTCPRCEHELVRWLDTGSKPDYSFDGGVNRQSVIAQKRATLQQAGGRGGKDEQHH